MSLNPKDERVSVKVKISLMLIVKFWRADIQLIHLR